MGLFEKHTSMQLRVDWGLVLYYKPDEKNWGSDVTLCMGMHWYLVLKVILQFWSGQCSIVGGTSGVLVRN